MKVAVLGSAGHWRLATDPLKPSDEGLEWIVVSVGGAAQGSKEDMAPVMEALVEKRQPARLLTDWQKVLDQEKPDIAIVNPPFYLLGSVIIACLERGIHVFGEKPLAIDRQELSEIMRLAMGPKAPKVTAMLAMRYAPVFIAGQRHITSGSLGKPLLMTAQKSYPLLGWNGMPREAFYHRRETYGGTIPWIGTHVIDQFLWFSGSRFTEVSAMHSPIPQLGHGEMEITASLQFKLASGCLANANLDFLRKRKEGPWGDDRLRVACENGLLEIQAGRAWVTDESGDPFELDLLPSPDMFTDFLQWVAEDRPMLLSTADCLNAAMAALLARDAADQRQTLQF